MGGGGQKQTTQETKEVRLPPWVEQAGQENYGFAKQIADRPFQQYQGKTVAGQDALYKQAQGLLPTLDDYYGNYADSTSGYNSVLGYNSQHYDPSTVNAMMLPQMDRGAYMNPITDYVERNAIENAARAGYTADTAIAARTAKSGGMGGSRDAVMRGVNAAETSRGIGDLSAELRSKAYDTATNAMMQDAGRKLTADTQTGQWRQQELSEYQQNQLRAQEQHLAASKGLADTADQAQAARMNEIATMLGFGQMNQEQKQRELDDVKAKWEAKYNAPLTALNIRLAALGMTPYGHTETGTSTTRSGGGGGAGQAMGFAGQFLQMLPMLASDRDLKTNIEKLDDSGPVPIYAYDYKADVAAAKKAKSPLPPKRVGPMAQDIERVAPHLVRKVGGKRVIDLTALGA
jgi:hypothetical protein